MIHLSLLEHCAVVSRTCYQQASVFDYETVKPFCANFSISTKTISYSTLCEYACMLKHAIIHRKTDIIKCHFISN